jgi:hypothetical protein
MRKKAREDAKMAAEKEKRLAQKRARANAIKMKKVAEAEAEHREAERERRLQEKRGQKRAAEEAALQAEREERIAARQQAKQQAAQQAAQPERAAAKPRREDTGRTAKQGAVKTKKKKGNIHDERGSLMTEYERRVQLHMKQIEEKRARAILAIETSCDETAAAVVENGRRVLSNAVYTQIPLHKPYGGVVPEIASRSHVQKIGSVVAAALEGAGFRLASWTRLRSQTVRGSSGRCWSA